MPKDNDGEIILPRMSGTTYIIEPSSDISDNLILKFEYSSEIKGNVYVDDSLEYEISSPNNNDIIIRDPDKIDTIVINIVNSSFEDPAAIKIKAYYDEPKPFYIRFTCNGHTPTLGGETIKVKFGADELIEEIKMSSPESPALVGPFPNIDTVAYAYLYYTADGGSRDLFAHYQEGGINGDWERACSLKVKNGTCEWDAIDYQYLCGIYTTENPPSEECDHFVKRIQWKKHPANIFSCGMNIEPINNIPTAVYNIPFENLFLIQHTHMVKIISYGSCTEWEVWEPYSGTSYKETVENWSIHWGTWSSIPQSCIGFGWWWWDNFEAHEVDGKCYPGDGDYIPYLSSFTGGNKLCILSDENGNNPLFTDVFIYYSTYVPYAASMEVNCLTGEPDDWNNYWWCCWGDDYCPYSDDPPYIVEDYETSNYSMKLTPLDRF